MGKFCQYCDSPLKENSRFCASCGKPVLTEETIAQKKAVSTEAHDAKADSKIDTVQQNKHWPVLVGALVVLVILFGGAYYSGLLPFGKKVSQAVPAISPDVVTTQSENNANARAAEQVNVGQNIDSLQMILKKYGLKDTVEATSLGNSNKGSLSIIGSSRGRRMLLVDTVNQQVAIVDLTDRSYNFLKQTGTTSLSTIFTMTILHGIHDRDQNAGIWDGDNHILPVFADYAFDGQGNVMPGRLTTGRGRSPSHYQEYLYEQRNVALANLFLTEMPALHANVKKNHLKL